MKQCVLQPDKVCDGCNRCNRCDLDPTKLCDNCFRCLEIGAQEYAEIPISHVFTELNPDLFELSGECMPDDALHIQSATLHGVHGSRRRGRVD